MNRRGFFGRLLGIVAACTFPVRKVAAAPATAFDTSTPLPVLNIKWGELKTFQIPVVYLDRWGEETGRGTITGKRRSVKFE